MVKNERMVSPRRAPKRVNPFTSHYLPHLSELLSSRCKLDDAEKLASNNFYIITDSINLNLEVARHFIKLHERKEIKSNVIDEIDWFN